MITMRVFRVVEKDNVPIGGIAIFCPRIPINKSAIENGETERICCAPSIYDCIISAEKVFCIDSNTQVLNLSVYSANVNVSELYQPMISDVPDAWHTNELWILNEYPFEKIGDATLTKQFDIANTSYARHMFCMDGEEPIVDRICATNIYGNERCFSFIDACPDNFSKALEYVERTSV